MFTVSDASKPFVETVRIQRFGCARDVAIELTGLHALIGPNDSGTSTVLHAIRTASELIRVGEQQLSHDGLLDPRGIFGSKISMEWSTHTVTCFRDANTQAWLATIAQR